jgi:hypothetical protein
MGDGRLSNGGENEDFRAHWIDGGDARMSIGTGIVCSWA